MTTESCVVPPFSTEPSYFDRALINAQEMSRLSSEEISKLLKVSKAIASENHLRYLNFGMPSESTLPALLSYTGVVFKHIHLQDFTEEDFRFAQQHLRITSFMYGLLRPMDGIYNYRLEGDVRLDCNAHQTMFESWREVLTEDFIRLIQEVGGVLMNLASGEMKGLFDWRKVEKSVQVITPEFKVLKNGKLSTVVVYAKMSRGEMTRYILKNRIEDPSLLKDFEWEGFRFDETLSSPNHYMFTMR